MHAQRGLAAKGRGADASGQGERFGCPVLPQGGSTTCSVAWRALRQRSWRSEGRLRPSKSNGVTNCVPRDRVCATTQSVGRVLSVGHVYSIVRVVCAQSVVHGVCAQSVVYRRALDALYVCGAACASYDGLDDTMAHGRPPARTHKYRKVHASSCRRQLLRAAR